MAASLPITPRQPARPRAWARRSVGRRPGEGDAGESAGGADAADRGGEEDVAGRRRSARVRRRSAASTPSSAARSMTAARAVPGRMRSSSGGVTSAPSRTTKTLARPASRTSSSSARMIGTVVVVAGAPATRASRGRPTCGRRPRPAGRTGASPPLAARGRTIRVDLPSRIGGAVEPSGAGVIDPQAAERDRLRAASQSAARSAGSSASKAARALAQSRQVGAEADRAPRDHQHGLEEAAAPRRGPGSRSKYPRPACLRILAPREAGGGSR